MTMTLLTTKLQIPPLGGRQVARARLLQRLDAGLHCPLTLVSAPAGYGKTVLLSHWARRLAGRDEERPLVQVAWVALDADDNHLARFWAYALAALDRLPPLHGALAKPLAELRSAAKPAIEPMLVGLINRLSELAPGTGLVLILDDFQVVSAPAIHASLDYLIENAPPALHLVLASRADPPLPLARLRARGALVELRSRDLRFTRDESAAFVNGVIHLNLSPAQTAELEARTEGWITGLQLAALALKGQSNSAAIVQAFTGQHRFVLTYLVEEVVARQPATVRSFLEQTAILERLNGPLCEAVTLQPNGAAMLAGLAQANLFTEPLDEGGDWYRCHHLFTEALRAQLQRTQPDLWATLQRRARDWLSQNGYLTEAIQHSRAAGDDAWIADLIERDYRSLVACGDLVTLRHWLERLPEAVIEARVKCCLAYAWALAYPGRFDELEHYLTRAEALAAGTASRGDKAVRSEILGLRAVAESLRGIVAGVVETANQALALAPPDDHLLQAVAWQAIGNTQRLCGRPVEARLAYENVLRLGAAIGGPVTLAATVRLGQVFVVQGHLREAEQVFLQALGQVNDHSGQLGMYASEAYTRLGDMYREWNQLARAHEHVTRGLELAKRADNVTALLSSYFTLARVQGAQAQLAAARDTLRDAGQLVQRLDFPHFIERVAGHVAWLDCLAGDMAGAATWASTYAASRTPAAAAEIVTDYQQALLARIELHLGHADAALRQLQTLAAEAQAADRGWTVIQTLVLTALAHNALGQQVEAGAALERALNLALPGGYVRLFIDEGEPMRRLLAEVARSGALNSVLQAYAARLLEAFSAESAQPVAPARAPAGSGLIEPLSARELEVLRLLAEGQSNREIAASLVISVGTVKSHINHILGKLAAHSRTQAIAHARTLELV